MNKWRTCPESLSISNTTWISSGGTTSTALCSTSGQGTPCPCLLIQNAKDPWRHPIFLPIPVPPAGGHVTELWELNPLSWDSDSWLSDRRIGWPPFIPRSSTMASLPATCLPWLLTCGSLVPKDSHWLPSFPKLVPPPFYQFWEHLTPLQ